MRAPPHAARRPASALLAPVLERAPAPPAPPAPPRLGTRLTLASLAERAGPPDRTPARRFACRLGPGPRLTAQRTDAAPAPLEHTDLPVAAPPAPDPPRRHPAAP